MGLLQTRYRSGRPSSSLAPPEPTPNVSFLFPVNPGSRLPVGVEVSCAVLENILLLPRGYATLLPPRRAAAPHVMGTPVFL